MPYSKLYTRNNFEKKKIHLSGPCCVPLGIHSYSLKFHSSGLLPYSKNDCSTTESN